MADMLVNLVKLTKDEKLIQNLKEEEIEIIRAMVPDKQKVLSWIRENFNSCWADEAEITFSRQPVSLILAVRGKEILGFACYESTARGFFGPTGVLDTERGKGIGKALLIEALHGLKEFGYIYGVIGGVGPREFYSKCVGAVEIPDSTPGIYKNLITGRQ